MGLTVQKMVILVQIFMAQHFWSSATTKQAFFYALLELLYSEFGIVANKQSKITGNLSYPIDYW